MIRYTQDVDFKCNGCGCEAHSKVCFGIDMDGKVSCNDGFHLDESSIPKGWTYKPYRPLDGKLANYNQSLPPYIFCPSCFPKEYIK